MGQVWRGQDIALHRSVAVKVLRSEYTGDPTFLARFRAEAQHAASLSHPNIAAVFDYGEEIAQDGTGETLAYLVMELVEGEPLSTLVAREGPLSTEATLSLLRQTAFGLGEAHKAGLVHRDVKPGNILVRPDGTVKITDFGIAWSARSVALTRTGQVIGTPQYLSPEQAEGRPTTPASDVYALGLIGYECLTGHAAFDGDNAVTIALKQVQQDPEPLPGELPAGVRGLICRALLKDPAARLPDGSAFVSAIDDVLAGRPLDGVPATVAVPLAATGELPRSRTAGSGGGQPGAPRSTAVRSPVRRARRRAGMVLLPLLALLAGAGIAAALLQALADPQPSSTALAAEQQSGGSIVLNAEDYVGRPVQEVTERLTALGLDVELREEVTEDTVPDRVTGIEPTGTSLEPGDRVVVTYAVAPSEAGGRSSGRGSAVTGAAVDADATPTEEVAPSGGSTATRSAAPAPVQPTGTMAATPTGSGPSETTSEATTSTSSEAPPTTTEATTTAATETEEAVD
jgi:serine/threonine-protein kinase